MVTASNNIKWMFFSLSFSINNHKFVSHLKTTNCSMLYLHLETAFFWIEKSTVKTGKLSHRNHDMIVVHRAGWRVTLRRNMKNSTARFQREKQVSRDLFTASTLWYLEMSGITTALLSWANGLLVTKKRESPRMTVMAWKTHYEVMSDQDVWTLFMSQQSSKREHITSMLKK